MKGIKWGSKLCAVTVLTSAIVGCGGGGGGTSTGGADPTGPSGGTTKDVFDRTADALAAFQGEALAHISIQLLGGSAFTQCQGSATSSAPSAESLRSTYTADSSGICSVKDGTRDCYYSADISGAVIVYHLLDSGGSDTHIISTLYKNEPSIVLINNNATTLGTITLNSTNFTPGCVNPPAGNYKYSSNDIAGQFSVAAYHVGSSPSAPALVVEDSLSCSSSGCVSLSDKVSLGFPFGSFQSDYEGYAVATATINGTVYNTTFGNLSPNKDRGNFLACPGTAQVSQLMDKCLFVELKKL